MQITTGKNAAVASDITKPIKAISAFNNIAKNPPHNATMAPTTRNAKNTHTNTIFVPP